MNKRFVMVLLAALTLSVQAFAQNVVTGKVSDQSGEVLPGAFVQVKGTNTGTTTDLDGRYELNTPANATLVFSFIGFETQEVAVGNQKTVNVVLAPDSMQLDEVVFVGYGTARKRDVSGAIASVNYGSDKNIANLPNPNALAALSSRVAGFNYAPTSSAGGDNTNTMTIRGMNVIPSNGQKTSSAQSLNKPLIIVDGVIFGGSINEINTNDVQSIDVLKDASAAAIYGSRAANGVIVITTKAAQSEKPVVNFNASISLSDWTRTPKYVTDETTFFRNRFYAKAASDASIAALDWSSYDKNNLFINDVERQAYTAGQNVNWIDEISRTGVGRKYDVSVSGRSKSASYYVSADYTRQQGIRIGDDYEKFNFLAKVDVDVRSWLKVGAKASYLGANSWGTPARIQNATWMSPYSFIYSQTPGYTDWYNSHPDGNTVSPLWGTGSGDSYLWTKNVSKSNNINGVAYAQIDFPFIPGLSYRVTAQARRGLGHSDSFSGPEIWVKTTDAAQMANPVSVGGTNAGGDSSWSDNIYWNVDNILTYTKDFDRHHFDVMFGYTREKSLNNSVSTSYTGFEVVPEFAWYDQDVALTPVIGRGASQTSAIGYLARANYNYANKYYATVNFRRDGYSVFYPGHKWGNYIGASAAWVLSNEDFIKDLGVFDFLKLRLSYGENGSRTIGAYATTSLVTSTVSNSGTRTHAWLGEQQAFGVKINQLPNYDLTWAKVSKGDLGIDFAILGSRVSGSIDAYIGSTTNMLVNRSAPYITGFSSVRANAGLVTNNGIEVVLNTVNINGNGNDTFRWESNIVFDHNSNKLKELYSGTKTDIASYLITPESYYALVEGEPITAVYDLNKLGIFQSQAEIDEYVDANGNKIMNDAVPGDVKFEDYSGPDGVPDGKINDYDKHVIGTMDPLFTLNFGNTLSWKGFSLYFNFRWMQGDKTHFLGLNPYYYIAGQGGGAQLKGVNKWVDSDYYTNHTNTFPRHGYNNATYSYQWWCNRSFLKLKDLSLSYTLPKKIVEPVGLSNVRVYVAGTDLFTITGWTGLDPETGGTIAAEAASSRYGANGTYKTLVFGVNLTF